MQLHYAAARDDFRTVQQQLAKGVSVNAKIKNVYIPEVNTPLAFAAKSLHASLKMVQMLVKAGANINPETSEPSITPLGLVASSRNVEKVKFLLDAGANAKYVSNNQYTPLFHAIHSYEINKTKQQIEIVRLLLEAGANPNIVTAFDGSMLEAALYFSNFTIIKMLLDAGANPDILEWSPLMRAVAVSNLEDVKREIRLGCDLEARTSNNWTAWSLAVALGDIEKAKFVIHSTALQENNLMLAVRKDNPEMVQWLISLGSNPNEIDEFRESALMMASEFNSTECVRVLLEAKANVNAEDKFQQTALNFACSPEVVKLLVGAGANVNHEECELYTPLKNVAERGHSDVVRTLLDLGADPDAGSDYTPLCIATDKDHLDIVKMLLAAGANPNIHKQTDRQSPLKCVKTVETLQVLLDAGADPNFTDARGQKPRHYHTDQELIAMLEQAELKGAR